MATFNELVNQIDENIEQQRDRGTAFEKLAVAYLENEPAFKNKYSDVWMLNEVPEEYHISKQDTGVDIVARDRATGKLTAVQAKYYRSKINKKNIDSFLAEVGKDYYSDGIIVTSTNDWNKNAKNATEYLTKEISVVGLSQLQNANFDWQLFDFNSRNNLTMKPKKLRDYQKEAIKKSLDYFKTNSRGKLVMAPGTGKTFTSLKIAEALFNEKGGNNYNVLYLVPSIQLLSQTLFNWNSDKSNEIEMVSFSVVSDKKATKKKQGEDDLSARDVGFPATTNVNELMANYNSIRETSSKTMTVVFSTYQSIDVIHDAQEAGYPEFDLIIADEAHRTTGAAKLGEDSMFTKVHSDKNVAGNLRLYQTATPKVYGPDAKKKAESNSIELSSMDDEEKYGKEIFRLGFGDAVSRGYLTDYKVSVLAVNENYVNKNMQKIMSSDENELKTSDIGKIIGIWNAMTKRNGMNGAITGAPMKRAIAFTDTIKHSEQVAKEFNNVVNDYLGKQAEDSFSVDVHHVDGGLNALEKKSQLDWLAGSIPENQARVLSNVRFLTEGIDVPNLDAIIFMSPKKSQVDIVQAVGRIMRRYEGKEYGYIILPIVIDANEDPAAALDNNKNYQEVWQVLNALRSIDERFEAEINKLELNKKKSGKINVIGVNTKPNHPITESGQGDGSVNGTGNDPKDLQLALDLGMDMKAIEQAFYGKIVQKVGDRRYLEDWSKDVAEIAKRHINKINDLIDSQSGAKMAFDTFIKGLRYNINDSIDEEQAIEMLAQHLITQPVFQALFGEYSFVNNNPVSKAMNDVISAFSLFGFDKEQKELEPFYESVKLRASGIDNAEAKQKIIVTLYDNFFRKGFKKTTEQMGIVFTPVEVVDFIVKSVDWALKKYLGRSLADENVHILDPFTGTGTFITRTLQYLKQQMDEGKITYADILRKYMHELHANEIVLLSYYIAAINIETFFDEINGPDEGYVPFNGIVLTDTFESTEEQPVIDDKVFGENNARLKEQQKEPITVIIGNPPYSAGQNNANDNNQNLHYKVLERRLRDTYVVNSSAQNKNSLYDSYIKAFRWASDRLKDKGIIGFVTNGGYIDSNSADGLRASLYKEFNYLYIFNLRGNARTQGEQRRKEKDNIFGQGTRTPIAISILVKDGSDAHELYYHDIGDYLSRKEKIQILENTGSVDELDWQRIIPDENHDWINQRDKEYSNYFPLYSKDSNSVFNDNCTGITTGRDAWTVGFSRNKVIINSEKMVNNYNDELKRFEDNNLKFNKENLNKDDSFVKWDDNLFFKFKSREYIVLDQNQVILYMYRPFVKKWIYFDNQIIQRQRKFKALTVSKQSPFLYTTGRGASSFSALISSLFVDKGLMSSGQGYYFSANGMGLITEPQPNMSNYGLQHYQLDSKELICYVYALLSSTEYKEKYSNNMTKEVPRLPVVAEKEKYVEVGKKLMDLHINYEEVPVYEGVHIVACENPSYVVKKMKFGKKRDAESGKVEKDKSTIIFNSDITIKDIPEKAYEYIVNGRSAIEWIMDQYQVKTDKKSGITDDPNDFSSDPKYIFNLLLRIINVSVQTVDLVNSLPKLEIIE
ncbi:restriction-modification system LlaBIII [Ligilactobacillus ruminis]|uniref:type ISP restriction/modification enzyme n=3 Tax=Bacteria TaxID=2 RepID=UPI00062CB967|nr:type ISP restriction/modification enzyme [Ligilactobacillus ruminis]KLA43321.1 restriction-modification system LlaBIII [Ligilactobacillus ruminis]